jgi:hypothetical protein
VPGDYTVRFSAGGEALRVPLTVRPDPRVDLARAQYAEQAAFQAELRQQIEGVHQGVIQLDEVRGQVDGLLERAGLHGEGGDTAAAGAGADAALERLGRVARALADSLTQVEDSLVQRETYDGQTVLNAPSRLNFQYIVLWGNVDGADSGLTEGARILFDDLNARWWPLRTRLQRLLDEGVDRVNRAAEAAGVVPVRKPQTPRVIS